MTGQCTAEAQNLRNAVQQGSSAYTGAVNEAGNLAGQGAGISSNLTPFLTEEMLHPQGYGQQGLSAMTAAAEGGAGGAASGLTGQAEQRAAASHNAGGYQAALDDAARQKMKAAAGTSENIAAENAKLQQQQQQEGASGLSKMYGEDLSGQLNAMNQQHEDINSEVNAGNSGWLQNTTGLLSSLNGAGFKGFKL